VIRWCPSSYRPSRSVACNSINSDEQGCPPVSTEWMTSFWVRTRNSVLGITKRWLDAKKRLRKTPICCSPHNWTRPPFPQVYYNLQLLLFTCPAITIIINYVLFVRCTNYFVIITRGRNIFSGFPFWTFFLLI